MRNGLIGLFGVTALTSALTAASCADYGSDSGTGGSAGAGTGGTAPSTGGSSAAGMASATGGTTGGTGTGGTGAGTGGGGTGGSTGGSSAGMVNAAGTGTSSGGVSGGSAGSGGTSGSGMSGGEAGAPMASCDNVTACGGDIVGTWAVQASCLVVSGNLDMSSVGIGCNTAPISGSVEVSGTWTAKSDMTFSDATTTKTAATGEKIAMSGACRTFSGQTAECGQMGNFCPIFGITTCACVDGAANMDCDCDATVEGQMGQMGIVNISAFAAGTYTIADNTITVTDGVEEAKYSYCVSGTTLTMTPVTTAETTTGMVAGTIVLEKQ